MALFSCPECGKQISDLATSCPNCGMPLKRDDRGTYDVVVKRENQFFLINPAMKILVDGVDTYQLSNGSSVVIPMTTGRHILLFSLGPRKTKTEFDVMQNMEISVKSNRITGEIEVNGYQLDSQTNTPNISVGIGVGGFFK